MSRPLRDAVNAALDRFVRTEIALGHRSWPAFRACGYTGLALAIVLTMGLAIHQGMSPWVMATVILASVLTFFGLARAVLVLTGRESLTYYHQQVAIVTVAVVLLRLLRQPLLPYLDADILGVGLFLACGRVGCLMVGCCHGRLCRWGVCYRQEHAKAGFPRYLVGVRLFPIQAVASLYVLSIVLVGSALVLGGRPPGAATAWYVVAYGVGRFCIEFVRGDSVRPYVWGFSEAQWTSLVLMGAVLGAEASGILTFRPWHLAATVWLALTMLIVALVRRFRRTPKHQLLHPRHVREVAAAVDLLSQQTTEGGLASEASSATSDVRVLGTSLGVLLSGGRIEEGSSSIHHYALSRRDGPMIQEWAGALADLIVKLRHADAQSELIAGGDGVYHLLIGPPAGKGATDQE